MSHGVIQGTQTGTGGQPQGQYTPTVQYIPQGQPQPQYVPQGPPQYQYQPQGWQPQGYQPQGYQPQGQGRPQYPYSPQGYQPQGQYSGSGYQPPQGPSYGQGMGTAPYSYQSYPQSSYGSQYPQAIAGQYPGMLVWDPSQGQKMMQPSTQFVSQVGQPVVSGSPQQPQPIQSNVQTTVTSVVTQPPIAPSTPSQTAACNYRLIYHAYFWSIDSSGFYCLCDHPSDICTVVWTHNSNHGPDAYRAAWYEYCCNNSTTICVSTVPGTVPNWAICPTTSLPVSTVSWVHLSTTSTTPVRSG